MTGKAVALYQLNTVLRQRDVPADISDPRHHLCRAANRREDFIPHGDFKADDFFASIRMTLIRIAVFVRCGQRYHAAIQIKQRCHAAAVEVIHKLAVVADTPKRKHGRDCAVLQNCHNADCINCKRINRRQRAVLRYKLLDNAARLGADMLKKLLYPFTVGIYFSIPLPQVPSTGL